MPLVVGLAGDQVVISAFHAYVDGLGLLEVLAALLGRAGDVVGARRRRAARRGLDGRTPGEVVFAPPAPGRRPAVGRRTETRTPSHAVPGRVRTSALVHAAVAAVVAHNAGRRAPQPPRDRRRRCGSARRAGRTRWRTGASCSGCVTWRACRRPEVEDLLRTAPLSGAGGSGAGRRPARGTAPCAPSHRGSARPCWSRTSATSTTTAARDLAFYPVTAGGTGMSLGAVGHDGTTVLTLRARAVRLGRGRALRAARPGRRAARRATPRVALRPLNHW